MHLFAIAAQIPHLSSVRLGQAVSAVGESFGLDLDTAWQCGREDRALAAAGVHHGARAAPRRYLHRAPDSITLFDGLPVDPSGARCAYDAEALAGGWDGWVTELEGQFCAARLDLERGSIEVLLDTFGLVPVFAAQHERGVLLSNSVAVIRLLLSLDQPDEVAISSMLGLGWAIERRTLLRGVRALEGGARHEVSAEGTMTAHVHFGPAQIARAAGTRTSAGETADYVASMTRNAVAGLRPVSCALTAGRDSRLVLAMARARALDVDYYTVGASAEEQDLQWAERLAEEFGLRHRAVVPVEREEVDWLAMAARFVDDTDGLSGLDRLVNYAEDPDRFALPADRRVGVRLSGIGGEFSHGANDTTNAFANLPLIGHMPGMQRRRLTRKTQAFRELMTPQARAIVDQGMRRFVAARRSEGWRTNDIAEAFFAFERLGSYGATIPRQAAAIDDLFSPYCSRRFVEFCLAFSAAARYVELPYERLLASLAPELRAFPFEFPLRRPRRRLASLRAAQEVASVLIAARGGAQRSNEGAPQPFAHRWFERHLAPMRELLAQPDSPLWELVDRSRVHSLMRGSAADRSGQLEGLLRVASLFLYFHGEPAAQQRGGDARLTTSD